MRQLDVCVCVHDDTCGRHIKVCSWDGADVCVCVCVCARARVRVRVRVDEAGCIQQGGRWVPKAIKKCIKVSICKHMRIVITFVSVFFCVLLCGAVKKVLLKKNVTSREAQRWVPN